MSEAAESPSATETTNRFTVDDHMRCDSCGYSLRGMDIDSVCPECGRSIRASLRPTIIRFDDTETLANWSSAIRTLAISSLMIGVLPVAWAALAVSQLFATLQSIWLAVLLATALPAYLAIEATVWWWGVRRSAI